MKAYVWLLLLPFGSILFALVWAFKRSAPIADVEIEKRIKPPRQIFTGHDDALRLRTKARRIAAAGIRSRAHLVESGAPVSDVLRRVK